MNSELHTSQVRLLLLSCSKAKRQSTGKVAALDLYDGPSFRVLRRFLSTAECKTNLDVIILSARYGFITPQKRIAAYDVRMAPGGGPTPNKLRAQLSAFTTGKYYSEVFLNLGADYLSRLPDLETVLEGSPAILTAQGRIGEKLHGMKQWLFNSEAAQ